MSKKGKMPNYETVDDYIAAQTPLAQNHLNTLRKIIHETAPDAQEVLNYKVPCFSFSPLAKKDQQIMISAYAKFVSFYPYQATMEAFKNEVSDYKTGKGSISFPYDSPLPTDLISKMVSYRRKEILDQLKS